METEHADDLALAAECARGVPAALAEFERRYRGEFAGALSRLRLPASAIDEVSQLVREKLFVGSDPKIKGYRGTGALVSWLRAVIVRTALDWRRREKHAPDTPEGDPLLAASGLFSAADDPEIENLRARYAEPFRLAFLDALRSLDVDRRNALRLYVAEGLNIDQIGALYGVHRSTVARWIEAARDAIKLEMRRLLQAKLRISAGEFDSLVRLCQSRLDVSFSQLGLATD